MECDVVRRCRQAARGSGRRIVSPAPSGPGGGPGGTGLRVAAGDRASPAPGRACPRPFRLKDDALLSLGHGAASPQGARRPPGLGRKPEERTVGRSLAPFTRPRPRRAGRAPAAEGSTDHVGAARAPGKAASRDRVRTRPSAAAAGHGLQGQVIVIVASNPPPPPGALALTLKSTSPECAQKKTYHCSFSTSAAWAIRPAPLGLQEKATDPSRASRGTGLTAMPLGPSRPSVMPVSAASAAAARERSPAAAARKRWPAATLARADPPSRRSPARPPPSRRRRSPSPSPCRPIPG